MVRISWHYPDMEITLPIDDPCSFCEYLAHRRPFTILERGRSTAILVTREQRGNGHVLVIPIAHRATLMDLDPSEDRAMMSALRRAAGAVAAAYRAEGIAVWQNNGVPAHQNIPHLHFHVAATLENGGTDWGDVPELSTTETDAIAAQLRPHLDADRPTN